MTKITDTLEERGSSHGQFADNAYYSQRIKAIARKSPNWKQGHLTAIQREALDNIAIKLSRILSGDPNHADNWHDIQGYAQLAEREITGE